MVNFIPAISRAHCCCIHWRGGGVLAALHARSDEEEEVVVGNCGNWRSEKMGWRLRTLRLNAPHSCANHTWK